MNGPIALTDEQEQAAKDWAADDRLWTTQDTVEANLRTFARVILKLSSASQRPPTEAPPRYECHPFDHIPGCDCYDNPQERNPIQKPAVPSPADPQPDYVEWLKQAKALVRSSPLWKRFIEHTPLENDIAVWMADFASIKEDEATLRWAAASEFARDVLAALGQPEPEPNATIDLTAIAASVAQLNTEYQKLREPTQRMLTLVYGENGWVVVPNPQAGMPKDEA